MAFHCMVPDGHTGCGESAMPFRTLHSSFMTGNAQVQLVGKHVTGREEGKKVPAGLISPGNLHRNSRGTCLCTVAALALHLMLVGFFDCIQAALYFGSLLQQVRVTEVGCCGNLVRVRSVQQLQCLGE